MTCAKAVFVQPIHSVFLGPVSMFACVFRHSRNVESQKGNESNFCHSVALFGFKMQDEFWGWGKLDGVVEIILV